MVFRLRLKNIECETETPGAGSDEIRFRFVAQRPRPGGYENRQVYSLRRVNIDSGDIVTVPPDEAILYDGPEEGVVEFSFLGLEEDKRSLATDLLDRFEANTQVYEEEYGAERDRWVRSLYLMMIATILLAVLVSAFGDWRAGIVTAVVSTIVTLLVSWWQKKRGPDPLAYARIHFDLDRLRPLLDALAGDRNLDPPAFENYATISDSMPALTHSFVNLRWGPQGLETSIRFTNNQLSDGTSYVVRLTYSMFDL